MAVACAATGGALAFDSAAWEARNAEMAAQAAKLKATYEEYSAKVRSPAENVTIPFETYASGVVKSVIVARQGQFFDHVGYIWAKDISVERYDEDGTLDMRLKAEYCLVDRLNRQCWAAGHVTAHHRKTVLEGTDAYYSTSNNFLKVMSDAKIVSEDVKMKGLKL